MAVQEMRKRKEEQMSDHDIKNVSMTVRVYPQLSAASCSVHCSKPEVRDAVRVVNGSTLFDQ